MQTAVIEFHGVTKTYRKPFRKGGIAAVSDVSFEVVPGEVCAFLGPNGAGKTTSINMLMGFLFSDSGEIRVLGYPPGDVRAKAQIGFLPENFAFYRYLTGPKLLRLHLALAGRKPSLAGSLIGDLIAKVRLSGYEGLKIAKYSRGMVQRIGIAQALLNDPQLLVLDEPTSGLDPAGRKEVLDLLVALKSAGKTVFLSSHILPEVEQICDRVVIIDRGRLVRAGRMSEMLSVSDRVEILVDHLPAELEQWAIQSGATIERSSRGIRIAIAAGLKRQAAESLWSAGCDIISLNPMKNTLEDLFLQLVDQGKEPA
jgi:ABC-2 type transport system ATP-binding protein